jgi:hypothetical protein
MLAYIRFLLWVLIAAFAVASCSGAYSISADYASIPKLKSYNHIEIKNDSLSDTSITQPVLRFVEIELAKKGFVKSDNPDFLIAVVSVTESQLRTQLYHDPFAFHPAYAWRNHTYAYYEQIINIDFIAKTQKQLFWQGSIKVPQGKVSYKRLHHSVHKLVNEHF